MVSYQAWVSIVFETLQDEGVQVDDIADGATVMQFAADSWQNHKGRLKRMSQSDARQAVDRLARDY